jgi:hypothetical protein
MAGNQVVLSFAGDTKKLEDSFGRVGDSAKRMGDKASGGDGFGKVGEAADNVDTKAMGFRDTLTGIQDTTKGLKSIASGDWGFTALLTLGAGIGDLGSGMFNFLVPAFKSTVGWVKALNFAFLTSPIFWIIAAVVILIAVIVLIATKTDWFQRLWKAAWGWIKDAAKNVWDWLKKVPGWIGDAFAKVRGWITAPFRAAWDWVKGASKNTWDFIKKIPGWIGTAFSKIAGFISAPFRNAFNLVATAWNNTVGRLSFTFPSWIPGIGGNSISVPNLPHFHAGGIVPGVAGTPTVALLQAGERVGSVASSGSGGEQWIRVDLGDLGDALLQPIAKAVSRRGGQVTHLGVRVVNGQVRA